MSRTSQWREGRSGDDNLTMSALEFRSSLSSLLQASEIRRILSVTERPDVLSLAGGLPNPDSFPVDDISAATERVLRNHSASALQYAKTEGIAGLRALIAETDAAETGRATTIDNVLVTTGSQQALDLLARVCIDPGDTIVVEAPGYLGAIAAFRARSPEWLPIAVDADGLDVEALAGHLEAGVRPRVVYTATDFQNPTGAVLSPERRTRLAALADTYDFLIIEDDPYGAIRFDCPKLAPLSSLTPRAIRLGSTSKSIAPGLRVGWAVGDPGIIADLTKAKQSSDLNTGALSQFILADLLGDPDWLAQRSKTLSEFYAARANTMLSAIAKHSVFGEVRAPRGGLFCWLDLPLDSAALLDRAVEHGVAFVPGAAFRTTEGVDGGARISFATCDDDDLRLAIDRLAAACAEMA